MRGIPAVRAGRGRLRGLIPPEAPSSELIEVPADAASAEHRERGSRFIAFVRAVSSENEARDFRAEIRRRFHDATHHVLAARLAAGTELLDDDGEPAGTGGRPVLDALAGSGLTDAAVVVARYFGGTKLGTGPLARAYATAAAQALASAGRRRLVRGVKLRLRFGYDDTGVVMRALDAADAVRLRETFSESTELEIGVPSTAAAGLRSVLRDSTAGRIRIAGGDESILLPA